MSGRLVPRTWQYAPDLYAPPRYRRACAYEAFIPSRLADRAFALAGDVAGVIADAEAAVQALNARARPALVPLARLLLRTESIASSKVEGLQVHPRELARAESRLDAGGKAGPDAREVLANIDAMQLAVEEACEVDGVAVEALIQIHAALMAGAPNSQIAGLIRTEQNWIGGNDYNPCGASFVPPPPEEVPALLADLCAFMAEEELPPLMQAGLVHAQFETIHPFMDGNGRTGRALIHVMLRRRGLAPSYVPPVSVVLAADKDAYLAGLNAFHQGRVDEWLLAFAVATARAAGLAANYLDAVQELQAEWREQLGVSGVRQDAIAWLLIDVLPAHPVITLPVAVAVANRTKAAVNNALRQLEEAGVLIRLSAGERNRSWEANGLLDLITGFSGGRSTI